MNLIEILQENGLLVTSTSMYGEDYIDLAIYGKIIRFGENWREVALAEIQRLGALRPPVIKSTEVGIPLSHYVRTMIFVYRREDEYFVLWRDCGRRWSEFSPMWLREKLERIMHAFSRPPVRRTLGEVEQIIRGVADLVIPAKTEFLQSYLPAPIAREIGHYWL
jgi:hypothetical protein